MIVTDAMLIEALRAYQHEHGASNREVAAKLNISHVSVGRWIAGGGLSPRHRPLLRGLVAHYLPDGARPRRATHYSEAPGRSLVLADSEPLVAVDGDVAPRPRPIPPPRAGRQARTLPLLCAVWCEAHGGLSHVAASAIDLASWEGDIVVVTDPRAEFAFLAAGDSMRTPGNGIADGDILVCTTQAALHTCRGAVVLAVYDDAAGDEHAVIKRLASLAAEVVLTSDNPAHAPIVIPAASVKFLWPVIEHRRRMI